MFEPGNLLKAWDMFKHDTLVNLMIVVGVCGAAVGEAQAFWDAYPSGVPTVIGPVSGTLSWEGDDFDSYSGVARLESSSTKNSLPHLDVTSGSLWSVQDGSNGLAVTYDDVFRMIANGWAGDDKIEWTDQVGHYRAMIDEWHGSLENWSGLHLFGRYQTSDDLYVASIRYDGTATIKKKYNAVYSTLASGALPSQYVDGTGHLVIDVWYDLKFAIIGNELTFLINDEPILFATDNSLTAGTTGIRTDNSTVYLDDWEILPASALYLEGDLDGDGFVGLDDLDIILSAWNQSVPPALEAADPSGDGFVGLDDLDVVLSNWNAGTPPATHVPEPSACLLGLVTGGLILRRGLSGKVVIS